jgi:hypothetical protein
MKPSSEALVVVQRQWDACNVRDLESFVTGTPDIQSDA